MKISNFIFYSVLASVTLAFVFGSYALEVVGIQYVSEGGSFLFKFHFYTYILLMMALVLGLSKADFSIRGALGPLFTYWVFFTVSILWMIVYGWLKSGFAGLAFIVDTLLSPVIIFALVLCLSKNHNARLIIVITIFVFINSSTAILEYLFGDHLFAHTSASGDYFRSQAWLSHPLNNALIVSSVAPVLLSCRVINPVITFSIVFLALLAFGARSAFMVFLFVSSFALFISIRYSYRSSGATLFQVVTYGVLLIFLPFVLYYLIINFDIGGRVFQNIYIDSSAQTRLDVFYVFNFLSFHDFLFGVPRDFMDNINYFIGNEVVENFYIAWILGYGLIGAGPLILSFLLFLYRVFKFSNIYSRLSLISFFLISMTNNALSVKTPALLFLLVIIAANLSFFDKDKSRA
jgi:hypothetical protein